MYFCGFVVGCGVFFVGCVVVGGGGMCEVGCVGVGVVFGDWFGFEDVWWYWSY